MTQVFGFGASINNPNPDKIVIVRTENEPPQNHHPILDDPRYSRLKPWTVTIKTTDKAIHTINVQWDVVDSEGMQHNFGQIFTMPPGGMVVRRNSACEFWPGGRIYKDIPGQPLMAVDPEQINLMEHAKSVTMSVDYVQFEDGSVIGPNVRDTAAKIANAKARKQQRGLQK
jgi:hypothetical protein